VHVFRRLLANAQDNRAPQEVPSVRAPCSQKKRERGVCLFLFFYILTALSFIIFFLCVAFFFFGWFLVGLCTAQRKISCFSPSSPLCPFEKGGKRGGGETSPKKSRDKKPQKRRDNKMFSKWSYLNTLCRSSQTKKAHLVLSLFEFFFFNVCLLCKARSLPR